MKRLLLAAVTLVPLLGSSAPAGASDPVWLIDPLRATLSARGDVNEFLVAYKGGQAVHVKASSATPFAPQVELYDGVGTLIGADYAQPGDAEAAVTMPPGGTVANILFLYVSGPGASAYPAQYVAWKGAP